MTKLLSVLMQVGSFAPFRSNNFKFSIVIGSQFYRKLNCNKIKENQCVLPAFATAVTLISLLAWQWQHFQPFWCFTAYFRTWCIKSSPRQQESKTYFVRTIKPISSLAQASLNLSSPTWEWRLCIVSSTVSPRRTLWHTSAHSMMFSSYCRMELVKPSHTISLAKENTPNLSVL